MKEDTNVIVERVGAAMREVHKIQLNKIKCMKEQLTLMHTQIFIFRSPFPFTQSLYKIYFNPELCLVHYTHLE